jgi:predicted DNA-binding protein YlxM (UPF0122 family)
MRKTREVLRLYFELKLGQRQIARSANVSQSTVHDYLERFQAAGRYQTRSTLLTSQVPVAQWHEQIGDPTIADGILDRLVHNAHRIELRGESMRKKRNPPRDDNNQNKDTDDKKP